MLVAARLNTTCRYPVIGNIASLAFLRLVIATRQPVSLVPPVSLILVLVFVSRSGTLDASSSTLLVLYRVDSSLFLKIDIG